MIINETCFMDSLKKNCILNWSYGWVLEYGGGNRAFKRQKSDFKNYKLNCITKKLKIKPMHRFADRYNEETLIDSLQEQVSDLTI
ncbi:hypothetical protein L1887_38648 [Cichorium endivia]|nr:hypothetical protein L1887_38648 [Cichorium endivia]